MKPGAVCGPEGRESSQGALGDGVWWGGLCASIILHSGVWREWWIGGQTRYDPPRSDEDTEKGLMFWGRGGRASPNVSYKCCSLATRPLKGETPEEFLGRWMVTGVFLVCTISSG